VWLYWTRTKKASRLSIIVIWPIHPQPLNGEILSSWMIRVAHANRYKVHDFYSQYFGRNRQIWNRDIDQFAPEWLINGLTKHTGLSKETIEDMTLRSYGGVVSDRFKNASVVRGLLALGIYHRKRRLYGQQFCPICLRADKTPYLRKAWRIASVCICDLHQTILQDRCNNCQRPMMAYRTDMFNKSGIPIYSGIDYCGTCRKRLVSNKPYSRKVPANLVQLQCKVYDALKGKSVLLGKEKIQAIDFIEGIRTLTTGAARLHMVKEQLNIGRIVFEKTDVILRFYLLSIVAELIENWPDQFIAFNKNTAFTYTNVISKNTDGNAPEWIKSAIES